MKKSHKIILAALGVLAGVALYNFSAPVKTAVQNNIAEFVGDVKIEYRDVESNGKVMKKPFVLGIFELPPAPNPIENAATLGGVDSNHNMVRDDVERHILLDTEYFTTPKVKAFGLQYARVGQYINTIDDHKDIDRRNMADHILLLATIENCSDFIDENSTYLQNQSRNSWWFAVLNVYQDLNQLIYNTDARQSSYLAVNGSLGGLINGPTNPGQYAYRYADFDLEALERGEYKWIPEKYKDRVVPNYTPGDGTPWKFVYKGRYLEGNLTKVVELFFGFKNLKETRQIHSLHAEICSTHTLEEMRDMNYIQGWDRYWEYQFSTTRPEDLL